MVQTEECVLLISDTHIGRVTPSYNVDIFKTRIEKLKHNLITVKETINRSYKLPVLKFRDF